VLVALGTPVRGRRGYRGLGTVVCARRDDARAAARALERSGVGDGPVRALPASVAGARLLVEALAADPARPRY
jgi:hypothetical protein